MLKQKYEREDQIPENMKGAYVADSSGVWVLDELDAEHPVVKKNSELVGENTRYKSLNTRLQNEKTQMESKTLPEGYIAVKSEDAPLIEQVKALNIPLKDVPNLKAENERFKQQELEQNALSLRLGAAAKLGYSADAFARLSKDLEIVQEGDNHFVNVRNDKGEIEKKPLTKEFVESSDTFKPFLSSLQATTPQPGNSHDPKPAGLSPDNEAAKLAQNGQARATHNAF
jgi:hypothetical protein